jgi:hypothetical protein
MNHENKNLNHPRVEALIRELSQLMGPDANTGMFEEMFTDLALLGRENKDNSDNKLIQMEITNPEALMPLLRVLPARIRDSIKLLNLQNPPT